MYSVKPYYGAQTTMSASDVMYKAPKYQESASLEVMTATDTTDPLCSLEQRQEAILLKLGELKATVQKLDSQMASRNVSCDSSINKKDVKLVGSSNEQKVSFSGKIPTSGNCKTDSPLKNNVLLDVVVSADCKKPPLSLFVMYELLKEKHKVFTTTYIHSSETSVPEKLVKIFQNGSNLTRKDHQLAVSLVWKKVNSSPSLMISPHNQTPITGECNIARYLWRLLHPEYDSANLIHAAQVDDWLDTAQNQIHNGNNKERSSAMKSMNSRLGKSEWLVGTSLSMADIVTWSMMHAAGIQNEVPSNVKRWINLCNNHSAFKLAKTII